MRPTAVLKAAVTTSYEWTRRLADDLADAPLGAPTAAGGNHPLWVMGHLAHARYGLLSMLTGKPNPVEHWTTLFAGGNEPQYSADGYPSYQEVLDVYAKGHQETLDLIDEYGDDRLDEIPKAVWERVRDLPDFKSVGRLLLFIAMHEMSHRGQLADTRRMLGRKPFV